MDQAPAGLATIFTNLVDDIQEQLNELKQSHTSLLKKQETHEAEQKDSRATIERLDNALNASQSQLEEHKHTIEELSASLAVAREENKAMKERLDGVWKAQRRVIANLLRVIRLLRF